MKAIVSYLDCRSPYSLVWLARLPQVLNDLSYYVELRPVLDDGNQMDWAAGTVSAEQQIVQLAEQAGAAAIHLPLTSRFDPLPIWQHAMRYSLDGTVNRYVINTVMAHVWQGAQPGMDPLCPERLAALPEELFDPVVPWKPSPHSAEHWLHANTQAARAAGITAFPACSVDGVVLMGLDGLGNLRTYVGDE